MAINGGQLVPPLPETTLEPENPIITEVSPRPTPSCASTMATPIHSLAASMSVSMSMFLTRFSTEPAPSHHTHIVCAASSMSATGPMAFTRVPTEPNPSHRTHMVYTATCGHTSSPRAGPGGSVSRSRRGLWLLGLVERLRLLIHMGHLWLLGQLRLLVYLG